MIKTIIGWLIVLAVLAGGWFGWQYWQGIDKAEWTFEEATVKKGNMLITIDATGTIEPEELVTVGAQVSGIITELGKDTEGQVVDYSSSVQAGQVLAKIDDVPVNLDIRQAQASEASAEASIATAHAAIANADANIEQAKAKHVQAKRDRDRAERLGAGEALSKSAFDQYVANEETTRAAVQVAEAQLKQAQAQLLAAEAQRQSAKAQLQKQERNLQYTTIVSPVDGVIINRLVNVGQTVVSSMSVANMFLIATDLRKLQIWSAVNEADIGKIRKGQQVTYRVDAFPNRVFTGIVNKVRYNATMTSNVVTYIVEIDTENPDLTLLPYLTANVAFIVQDLRDALLVPNAAVRFMPEEKYIDPAVLAEYEGEQQRQQELKLAASPDVLNTIWVKYGDYVRPMWVKTGQSNGMQTPVTGDGVADGLAVVIGAIQADQEDKAVGSSNPFAPKMPSRRPANAGAVTNKANATNTGGGSGGSPQPR